MQLQWGLELSSLKKHNKSGPYNLHNPISGNVRMFFLFSFFLMLATGLKRVGTGACRFSFSSQTSLKTSGHEFLEFWCWNLVPLLPDIGFPAANEFKIFRLMMSQMFSIVERSELQADQFSTRTLLTQSRALVIAAVCGFALFCWNTQGHPWNRRRLEGSICCSKTFIYLSAFIVPFKTYKMPIPAAISPCSPRPVAHWS